VVVYEYFEQFSLLLPEQSGLLIILNRFLLSFQ